MKLMMYIGNDLIEAISLNDADIPKPGYVGSFKRNLKIKYRELIQQYPDPPEFLIIEPTPNNTEIIVRTNASGEQFPYDFPNENLSTSQ